MSTKHRNAGGPFLIFEPGLGVTGSIELNGHIKGSNQGLQVQSNANITGSLTLEVPAAAGTHGLKIDMNETGAYKALEIDSESSAVNTIKGKFPLHLEQNISDGYGLKVYRHLAEAGSDELVSFIDNNTNNTQTTLMIRQNGTGDILNLFDHTTEVFTVLDGGNVGIGQPVPTKTLTLEFTSTDTTVASGHGLNGAGAGKGLLIENASSTANTYANLDFRANSFDARIAAVTDGNSNDGRIAFITDGGTVTEAMTITGVDSSHNVGIGVTDPDQKLEVAGAIHVSGEVSSPSAPADGDGGILYVKSDGKPYWVSNEVSEVDLTLTSTVTITDNESTNEDNKVIFGAGAAGSGNIGLEADGDFTYNPSTGTVTATAFAGTVTTAAQTNITSVGTLTGLTVSGDIALSGDSAQISKTGMNSNTVFLQCTAPDNDVEVLRVSHNSTTLNAFNYGYSLVYSGSGSGADNTFQLMADNSDSGPRTPVWTAYNDGGFQIGSSGAKVTIIEDNDNLGTSDTKLCTQGNVKAYVDANAGGGGVSMSGTANGVVTKDGNSTIVAETNLIFDGNNLEIGQPGGGSISSDFARVKIQGLSSDVNGQGALQLEDNGGNNRWNINVRPSSGLTFTHNGDSGHMFRINDPDPNLTTSNVNIFTGQHRSLPQGSELMAEHVGKIVCASGIYNNIDGTSKPNITNTHPTILLSSKRNEKTVYGVVAGFEKPGSEREFGDGLMAMLVSKDPLDNRVIINSLGEGGIWVCNINGNLENGDYITTCEIPGLGMKQDTEMLCNYTVAKITQDCNFRKNAANYDVEEFEFEGKTYRKAFVGCTYHCG